MFKGTEKLSLIVAGVELLRTKSFIHSGSCDQRTSALFFLI